MTFEVALLVFGILLLLVGLVGKVKAKELEVGTDSRVARVVMALVGTALLVLSFNPDVLRQQERADEFPGTDRTQTGAQDTQQDTGPEQPAGQLRGVYTIQQKSTGRHLDAHQDQGRDFGVVTRDPQGNDTQRWIITPIGENTYTIQQKSTGRHVDAHQDQGHDFGVVTRDPQGNDTQRWIITPIGENTYTIQQKSTGRYVDAHQDHSRDFGVVTRRAQGDDTQRWIIRRSP